MLVSCRDKFAAYETSAADSIHPCTYYVCFCQTDHAQQLPRHSHSVGKAPTQPQHSTHLGVGVPAVACTLDITMLLLIPRPITAGHRSRQLSIIMLAMEPVAGPRTHYATVLIAFHTLQFIEYRTIHHRSLQLHPSLPESLQPSPEPCFRVDMPPLKMAWRGSPPPWHRSLVLLLP